MTVNNDEVKLGLRRGGAGQSTIRKSKSPSRLIPEELRRSFSAPASQQSQQQQLDEYQEFSILKTLSSGQFSKIYLARPELGSGANKNNENKEALVLKAFSSSVISAEDFLTEMELNYFLSPHPNIVTSYNVSFEWNEMYLYPQEYAPHGDLSRFLKKDSPLAENQVKSVAGQITAALEFIHSLNLIHRDVKPENVLVFARDMSLVKLADFGAMVVSRTLLTKCSSSASCQESSSTCETIKDKRKLAYLPPEICGILPQEKYHCYSSIDVWQMGILLFACLTGGSTPWKLADVLKDSAFNHYCDWSKRRCNKTPLAFQPFSSRLTRLLKRLLEPKPTQRCKIQEVNKYLKDDWINVTSKSSFSLIFGSDSKTNVSRSNSDMDQPPKRGTSCRKSMLRGKSRKVKTTNGSETEPVFRICCKFQTKNEQGRKPSFSS